MGWWKNGEDLLGDGPVDLFQEGLKDIGAEYGKPSWQEFLDALDAALDAGRLHAAFEPPPDLKSDPQRAQSALRQALVEILDQIREEYQERRERKPTLSELIGTAHFSVAGRPESFLTTDGSSSLKNLTVEQKR